MTKKDLLEILKDFDNDSEIKFFEFGGDEAGMSLKRIYEDFGEIVFLLNK